MGLHLPFHLMHFPMSSGLAPDGKPFSCGGLTHDNIKANWERFRAGVRGLRSWNAERLYMGECVICGTTLAVPHTLNPNHKAPKADSFQAARKSRVLP